MAVDSGTQPRRSGRLRRLRDLHFEEKLLSEATDQQNHNESMKMYTVRRVEVATAQVGKFCSRNVYGYG